MKTIVRATSTIMLFFTAVACSLCAASQPLRVMTYNIRNCIGMDNEADITRTANVIRRYNADIVAMQEVDSCTTRSKGIYVAGRLAEETGLHATFAPAIDFNGGRYGIALLSRTVPTAVHRLALPGREEKRAALIAVFPEYAVCCTHLSLTPEDQLASVNILSDTLTKLVPDMPILLMGDFNAEPESFTIIELRKSFTPLSLPTDHTWPADKPITTIDYIFVSGMDNFCLTSEPIVADESTASDHRPIIIDLKLYKKP